MATRKPKVELVEDGYVVEDSARLAYKLSLKPDDPKPYTCKTLARSVVAGNITQAEAEEHNPKFVAWAKSRKAHKLPINATPKALQAAKGKTSTPAKAAAAEKPAEASKTITKAKAARMSKATLLAKMSDGYTIA